MRLRGLAGGSCTVLIAALITALAATGCGTTGLSEAGSGDTTHGKDLFKSKCGQCHTLADAGTKGVIGPNLDDAFRQSRADGLGTGTIRAVVRNQISYAVEEPTTGSPGMPRDIVTGDDAESVAAYVASVASLPVRAEPGAEAQGGGGGGDAVDGKSIFAAAGCGGCHTLKAAGASGNVGPNLDDSKPPKELVIDRVTHGKGVMPSFKDDYSAEQIAAVAGFVVENAGK
ncbi:MAG TPA: c-type cytochrome [Gaiellaceae bacterium]|nr:c-type cytochrome [Gaiellaceae bacterium]